MRYVHAFACLFLLASRCQALPSALSSGSLTARGSSSDSKEPSPTTVTDKPPIHGTKSMQSSGTNIHQARVRPSTSTQIEHSTRLFGVNIHQAPDGTTPSAHSSGSTRLFGVDIQKSASPAGHQPARAGSKVCENKRPAKETGHSQTYGSIRAPKRKWWNIAGGKPSVPYGTSKAYWRYKKYRDKKKLKKQEAHDEHPSAHQQHPPRGPGSPDAGSHAVSKRRAAEQTLE